MLRFLLAVVLAAVSGCAIAQRSDKIEIRGEAEASLSGAFEWMPRVKVSAGLLIEDGHARNQDGAILALVIGGLFISTGCTFAGPPKEEAKEIMSVTASAFSKAAVEQLAVEVKKAVAEGGITQERAVAVAENIAHAAADRALDKMIELEQKKRESEEKGENVPFYVTAVLYFLNEVRKARRDGFLTRRDDNKNGIPDDEEVPPTRRPPAG